MNRQPPTWQVPIFHGPRDGGGGKQTGKAARLFVRCGFAYVHYFVPQVGGKRKYLTVHMYHGSNIFLRL